DAGVAFVHRCFMLRAQMHEMFFRLEHLILFLRFDIRKRLFHHPVLLPGYHLLEEDVSDNEPNDQGHRRAYKYWYHTEKFI
ncbi:MAG: hypothetical protein J6X20_07195, partial [Bacteroidales bacterium]|nr:hypothetical protein [Bacteroidales bacterium]